MWKFIIVSSGVVLFALTAHAGGAVPGQPGKASQVKRTIEVQMGDDMRYVPAQIAVVRGETVRLKVMNTGKMRHELVLGTATALRKHAELMKKHPHMEHDDPNAVSVPPGEAREILWKFSAGGTVEFACLIPGHYEAGMTGRVHVSQ